MRSGLHRGGHRFSLWNRCRIPGETLQSKFLYISHMECEETPIGFIITSKSFLTTVFILHWTILYSKCFLHLVSTGECHKPCEERTIVSVRLVFDDVIVKTTGLSQLFFDEWEHERRLKIHWVHMKLLKGILPSEWEKVIIFLIPCSRIMKNDPWLCRA